MIQLHFALLSVIAFVLQNACCKEYGRRFPDTLYAQAAMTLLSTAIVSAMMALLGGARLMSLKAYCIAACFGLFFVITLCAMTLAMSCGHMGVTLLIQNSSLITPAIIGLLFWNERLTLCKGLGAAAILLMLALSSGDGSAPTDPEMRRNWNRKRWFFFTALSFIGDSTLNVLQKLMAMECENTPSVVFTFWTSLFSVAVALMIVLFCRARGEERLTSDKKTRLSFAACCLGIGVGTAGGNAYTILALTLLPGVVMFPFQQGGVVLLMWLIGVAVYREKITPRGLAMLISGLSGIVLLNL